MLSIPAAPLKHDPAQIRRAQPPLRFDQSLEQLERSRVITPRERRGLEAGQLLAPIDDCGIKEPKILYFGTSDRMLPS